jgi:hypothetical protein
METMAKLNAERVKADEERRKADAARRKEAAKAAKAAQEETDRKRAEAEARWADRKAGASTILDFCYQHRISPAFFYELKRDGKAPRITHLGPQKQIITDEDAAAWRKAMAEASEEAVVL